MSIDLIIDAGLFISCSLIFYAWYFTKKDLRQWQKLEANQARRVQELMAALDIANETIVAIGQFKTQPGMETVSPAIARKILDLQADNLKITTELNKMRLQAAKYMDLYRAERYKPHRK